MLRGRIRWSREYRIRPPPPTRCLRLPTSSFSAASISSLQLYTFRWASQRSRPTCLRRPTPCSSRAATADTDSTPAAVLNERPCHRRLLSRLLLVLDLQLPLPLHLHRARELIRLRRALAAHRRRQADKSQRQPAPESTDTTARFQPPPPTSET